MTFLNLKNKKRSISEWADLISKRTLISFTIISTMIFFSSYFIKLEMSSKNRMIEIVALTNEQLIALTDLSTRISFFTRKSETKKGLRFITMVQKDINKRAEELQKKQKKINILSQDDIEKSFFFSQDLKKKKRTLERTNQAIKKLKSDINLFTQAPPKIIQLIFNQDSGRHFDYTPDQKTFQALYDYNNHIMKESIQQSEQFSSFHIVLLTSLLCGVWSMWLLALKPIIYSLKKVVLLYDESKKELEYQVNYDALTNLYNRKYFSTLLDDISEYKNNKFIYLLTIDLDKFKTINDKYGHPAGDFLLHKVSKILKKQREENEFNFRIGGDEFSIIVFSCKDINHIKQKAQRINIATIKSLHHEDNLIDFSISIGISFQEVKKYNQKNLIRSADHALYFAKNSGGNNYAVYSELTLPGKQNYLKLDSEIFLAIKEKQFEVFYQPVVYLPENKIVAMEALLRWKHETLGFLSPIEWLVLVQRNDLFSEISSILINEVQRHIKIWQSKEVEPFRININATENISEYEIIIKQLVYPQSHLPKDSIFPIGVEITESIVLDRNIHEIIRRIELMRKHNISILLDDFGTGYATLSHLMKLPFDFIKVDKSFVINMNKNPENKAIVDTIIRLAKSLGKKLICEGVENKKTLEVLGSMGCDYIQGYYYSKPIPFKETYHLLAPRHVH